ncbi:hypothetical protein AB0230_15240 [Microbacterium sp. NPDC089190]|uniref:hypothetical protein n=1 Tax=Microbacterium sp. NPDC089190 TaxID=3155063 RepID=UPI00344E9040
MERDEESPEQRALRSIRAIDAGADIGAEALELSNAFTDRHTARIAAWVKRRRGSSADTDAPGGA